MTAIEPAVQSGPLEGRCVRRKSNGEPCTNYPIRGGTVCTAHGGRNSNTARKALVRAEISDWGLNDHHVDPGETLLRLVSQSARRATFYADLLEHAYAQAEIEDSRRLDRAIEKAEEAGELDIEEGVILPTGVKALIGKKYTLSADGDRVETGEAIRGLAMLEIKERELCANFAAKAIAAGLAERQVRLAEQQASTFYSAMIYVLERQGITGPALLAARNDAANYLDGDVAG